MRDIATDSQTAYNYLGNEGGRAFIGLIADFRAAFFASDVPGGPSSVVRVGDHFKLDWFISTGCTLKTIIAASSNDDDAWRRAHRIHLQSVTLGEEVLT